MEDKQQPQQKPSSVNYAYPDQMKAQAQEIASTIRVLLEIPKSISTLRRVFRGEALYQGDDGSTTWIQTVKPVFVKLDPITREPLKAKVQTPEGEREIYLPNDEAIEEVLSELYFMGVNQITPFTNLSQDNVLDDLKEFECKLAGVLALKQVDWGLDKAFMPMIQTKIKTVVQDARFMCVNGATMRAISQQVSRIEQVIEGSRENKQQVYK